MSALQRQHLPLLLLVVTLPDTEFPFMPAATLSSNIDAVNCAFGFLDETFFTARLYSYIVCNGVRFTSIYLIHSLGLFPFIFFLANFGITKTAVIGANLNFECINQNIDLVIPTCNSKFCSA